MTEAGSIKVPVKMLLNPVHFLSLGFGSGLSPYAPGTAGTLVAIPLFIVMAQLDPGLYLLIVAVLFISGVGLCAYTARTLGVHDHGAIVWDEVVGYLLTMFVVPASFVTIALGFILFRLFDIWKPWPIRVVDSKVAGGFGIMLDDLLAAAYAAILLQLVLYIMGGSTVAGF